MFKTPKPVLLAAFLIPGAALAQINVGDELGTTETAIRSALEAQGYIVEEIEFEDGEIEVEASTGGQLFEFELSEAGLVTEVENEDDDDDDDDDDDEDDEDEDDDDDDDDDEDEDDEDSDDD